MLRGIENRCYARARIQASSKVCPPLPPPPPPKSQTQQPAEPKPQQLPCPQDQARPQKNTNRASSPPTPPSPPSPPSNPRSPPLQPLKPPNPSKQLVQPRALVPPEQQLPVLRRVQALRRLLKQLQRQPHPRSRRRLSARGFRLVRCRGPLARPNERKGRTLKGSWGKTGRSSFRFFLLLANTAYSKKNRKELLGRFTWTHKKMRLRIGTFFLRVPFFHSNPKRISGNQWPVSKTLS